MRILVVEDEADLNLLLCKVLTKAGYTVDGCLDGEDAQAEARQVLEEKGLNRTITVSCIGDTRLTTGKTVVVRQPATGLSGVFWIESDQHSWSGGSYMTTLELELRNMMYQSESGGDLE